MPRRRRKPELHSNHERWLLTYADLITLLLAFFIVMYSMSRLDAKKFGRMADAFNGVLRGGQAVLQPASADAQGAGLLDLGELKSLGHEIQEKVVAEELQDKIETLQDERGLVIRVMESAAFDPGSADLKPQMHSILNLLAEELRAMDNHLRVEGHTDDRPIRTARFPSNWELSTSRATGVVRYLVEELKLDPTRVSALGYGEFRPIATNADADGRARNRRVDLIVLADRSAEPVSKPAPGLSPLARADSVLGSVPTLNAPR
jgi:chemotaxis protein MotB